MQCKICASAKLSALDDGKKIYRHCSDCNYIFLDSTYYLSTVEEKRRYSLHNNTIQNNGYVNMFERFFERVFPHIGDVKTILDFGCGPGPVMTELLKRRGYKVSLYDIYFHNKKENLNATYDLVISTEVFEHLSDPLNIFENIIRNCVKKSGYIALMTRMHPNNNQKFKNWYYKTDETHIGFFSKETFEFLAQKLNLKILFIDTHDTVVFQKH